MSNSLFILASNFRIEFVKFKLGQLTCRILLNKIKHLYKNLHAVLYLPFKNAIFLFYARHVKNDKSKKDINFLMYSLTFYLSFTSECL